ncbi:phosphosulfolactate synthase [Aneurinibacillus sp. Ricciae_BoGa-3]|uniref:phosphosulfolactate synthase n=1 Tax=Aneurinibacillus sp. Ricciae_BoGa-3 TaxID=3022697 RepID=UPI00233F7CCE|nr:phosphosulfolactate synthase [Aneurinibacillus sp. Ricciae_BoGa-3]WCK53155.1 phosphosulfolactate synthase [Aneurinibacillus sp. Ricciae_BoGa-3]
MNPNHNLQWHPLLHDPSCERKAKPRATGLTMVIDQGIGPRMFEEMLAIAAPYIDFIKLGFGTSTLYPFDVLRQKILLANEAGVRIYPGGTFFEIAYQCDLLNSYLETLARAGFNCVEVSDGSISMPGDVRSSLIKMCVSQGFAVISECGKKVSGTNLTMDELEETLYKDLEAGSSYVIVEGRESGMNVGIYDKQGKPDYEFLCAVETLIPKSIRNRLIWEAPMRQQQIDFIRFFGRNVNMGNIQPSETYSLESLRRGLRSDTLSEAVIESN